jgi:hypothetical protein
MWFNARCTVAGPFEAKAASNAASYTKLVPTQACTDADCAGSEQPSSGLPRRPRSPGPTAVCAGVARTPQIPPWSGAPQRAERRFAPGTPPDASSIRDRAHSTTLSPTGPDSPRVTFISPIPGMSVPHLVDINSPRATFISPRVGMSSPLLVDVNSPCTAVISSFAEMSSPHLMDVNSPRVTLVSPFAGMPVSHLANVDRPLYYLKIT